MNLTQGQSSVRVYFTKLKTIWEELSNYRPACSCGKCNCGGTKKLVDHYHIEYVMSFLMGLNDSLAQVRAQILMMDPIPSIMKCLLSFPKRNISDLLASAHLESVIQWHSMLRMKKRSQI